MAFRNRIFFFIVLLMVCLCVPHSLFSTQFGFKMTSNTQQVRSFLENGQGSANAKMVFSNIWNKDNSVSLCYIDFFEEAATPGVHTINAASGGKVPVISPDGRWVVFAKGDGVEAGSTVGKRSSVYICKIAIDAVPVLVKADSACEPRFMQNTNTLTVIYSTLAPNYAWEGIGKTMKVNVDVTSGTPVVGTPQVLFQYGGYTGGLSWNGRYLCAGGGDIVMLDLNSGKTRPDTVSYCANSCNASISSSSIYTNTMMHLTMSGSHPHINGGKQWGIWQVILINNSNGDLLKGYSYPTTFQYPLQTNPETWTPGLARWHHCEWSNHPYFAAATLNVDRFFEVGGEYMNTFYQERLYLINLKNSEQLEILRPDTIKYSGVPDDRSGFHWPYLWVQAPGGFSEDPYWLAESTPIYPHKQYQSIRTRHCNIQRNNHLITAGSPITSVSIFQLQGRQVYHSDFQVPVTAFNIPTLPCGFYLVRLHTPNNEEFNLRFTESGAIY